MSVCAGGVGGERGEDEGGNVILSFVFSTISF